MSAPAELRVPGLPAGGFAKYHALGNDYLVVCHHAGAGGPAPPAGGMPADHVQALCDRHRGVGADGLLLLGPPPAASEASAAVAIYNSDGSLAERSGNGLRIAARALFELGAAPPPHVRLWTATGAVSVAQLGPAGADAYHLEAAMGRPAWGAAAVGADAAELAAAAAPGAEPATVRLRLGDAGGERQVSLVLVAVGNPHAVWWVDDLDAASFARWAPLIAASPAFPRGINVQMAARRGRQALAALVWERGAGPTQASGTSACAVAASAWRAERCRGSLAVEMPGGVLWVGRAADGTLRLQGPVATICLGQSGPATAAGGRGAALAPAAP